MIDMILAEPWISHDELAARFGYSPSWISTVMATDAFKVAFEARKTETVDPRLLATITEQFEGILARSMAILRDKLNGPSNSINDQLVLRTMELSARSLGYGARHEQPPVRVDVHNHLEGLRDNLVTLLRTERARASEIIDGEIEGHGPGQHPPRVEAHSGHTAGRAAASPVQPSISGPAPERADVQQPNQPA